MNNTSIDELVSRAQKARDGWGPTCKRCGDEEFRVDGYCSVYCRDMAELEEMLAGLLDNSEPDENGIKSCPACNSFGASLHSWNGKDYVWCGNIGCAVTGPLAETEAEAVKKWNNLPRRPQGVTK